MYILLLWLTNFYPPGSHKNWIGCFSSYLGISLQGFSLGLRFQGFTRICGITNLNTVRIPGDFSYQHSGPLFYEIWSSLTQALQDGKWALRFFLKYPQQLNSDEFQTLGYIKDAITCIFWGWNSILCSKKGKRKRKKWKTKKTEERTERGFVTKNLITGKSPSLDKVKCTTTLRVLGSKQAKSCCISNVQISNNF